MNTTHETDAGQRVHIRYLIRRDFREVLAIEAAGFDQPWGQEEFLARLRRRDVIGMVAEAGEAIVGFMVYRLGRREIEVLDFATHPDFRRRGVGRQMVAKLANKLANERRTRIELEDRESNLAGHLFWRACGFRATEVLRGHYRDEGGYRFVYTHEGEES